MAKGKTGATSQREYNIWAMMRQRCNNPKAENYPNYGGKGVSVADRWGRFSNFYEDMGPCPDKFSLDRIDTAGDYEPSNCRWTSNETQQNNKRNTIRITAFGETLGLAQWVRRTGLTRDMIHHRIYVMGMTPEEAIQAPRMSHNICKVHQYTKEGEFIAEYSSLSAAAKALGVDKRSIYPAVAGKAKTAIGYKWSYAEKD